MWIDEILSEYKDEGWEEIGDHVWKNGRDEFINLVQLKMNKM
jgi:dissimilatory sulfite reductase (desulfoviridin) alpha/beta subunit